MNESDKIELLFRATDEIQVIRSEANAKVEKVFRDLCRDLENEAGLSHQEAIYELYLLGARIDPSALET